MFIVLGGITVLVGIWAYFCLPDSPMNCGFLDEQEILQALERVSVNQTGVGVKKFQMSQAVELALDPQIYLLILITVLVSTQSPRACSVNQTNSF